MTANRPPRIRSPSWCIPFSLKWPQSRQDLESKSNPVTEDVEKKRASDELQAMHRYQNKTCHIFLPLYISFSAKYVAEIYIAGEVTWEFPFTLCKNYDIISMDIWIISLYAIYAHILYVSELKYNLSKAPCIFILHGLLLVCPVANRYFGQCNQ